MRLVRFDAGAGPRLGALLDDGAALDLAAAAEARGAPGAAFADMPDLIAAGDLALDFARGLAERAEAGDAPDHARVADPRLLSPLPRPAALRLCTVNTGHFVGARRAAAALVKAEAGLDVGVPGDAPPPFFFDAPLFYRGNHKHLGGPGDPIAWPSFARFLDFELEIAAVIGRGGRDLGRADAEAAIFGYTILNDVSARLPQLTEMRLGVGPCKGKGFDGALKIGPAIVTADAFDPAAGRAEIRINGETVSETDIAGAAFDWPEIVGFASRGETLEPTEIISGGCVERGSGIELGRWLAPGDRLALRVDGLGTLENPISQIES